MNIFICGQKSFGRAVLKRLHEDGHNIVGCAPPPQEKYYDKMQGMAAFYNIPIITDCDRLTANDIPENTDLIVSAHSHWYISDKCLEKAKYGGIGFHPSLLPRHRGQDAVRWTVHMGDYVTGATIYELSQKVDGGDIYAQEVIWVNPEWNYHKLWEEIFPVGVELMSKVAKEIEEGTYRKHAQAEENATWEPSWNRPRLKRNDLIMLS